MPALLVAVERDALVAVFVTVTDALGMTAPLESRTSPVIDPNVCADATEEKRNKPASAATKERKIPLILVRMKTHSFQGVALPSEYPASVWLLGRHRLYLQPHAGLDVFRGLLF